MNERPKARVMFTDGAGLERIRRGSGFLVFGDDNNGLTPHRVVVTPLLEGDPAPGDRVAWEEFDDNALVCSPPCRGYDGGDPVIVLSRGVYMLARISDISPIPEPKTAEELAEAVKEALRPQAIGEDVPKHRRDAFVALDELVKRAITKE